MAQKDGDDDDDDEIFAFMEKYIIYIVFASGNIELDTYLISRS